MIDTTSKDYKFLKFLSNAALEYASVSRSRVAALVVYKNMPIALGRNSKKSHPAMLQFGRTCNHIFLHAEIAAIIM